ncbi:sulfatase family protein [Tundrisphaera sp. TA3]|uniref:sulfatase family protein n=1 Tax=Tundrisphaera sp. TA3 TaxID=3435775 RepID=UPI003EBFFA43
MNVIVVACNGLHLGFLGAYGNSWIETPHLDRLAAEGVVFDHHFPENLTTLPTRRSWWTGRYGFPDPDSGWTALRHDEAILPDLLWNQGVRSALISDVPLLREAGQGFGRGWDEVRWIRGLGYDPLVPPGDPRAGRIRVADEPGLRLPPKDDPDYGLWKERWEQFLRNRAVLTRDDPENAGAARAVREAVAWLDGRGDDPAPFLLWLDLFSPHGPWDAPPAYRDLYAANEPDEFEAGEEGDLVEEDDDLTLEDVRVLIDVPAGAVGDVIDEEELLRLRRTYAGAVTFLDKQLGVLFEALKARGRFDDTLIVFTSDQGEPLGEHGYVRRFRPWLYEELIHTPLIVRMPGGEFGGSRQPALVQTVDLLPTVLSALGLPPDEKAHGRDLLPLIRGEVARVRDYACLGMDVEEFAIRTPHWHLIVPIEVDPDDPPRPPELYRKPEDRWDQNDVSAENPEVAEHLELTLRRFADAVGRDAIDEVPPLRDIARSEG